jgi:uncharacterized protein
MRRRVRGAVVAVIVAAAIFFAIGSWLTASNLEATLRVGAAMAQGSGWPAPQGPADIGFVGDPRSAYGFDFEDVPVRTDLGDAPAWFVPPAPATSATNTWIIFVHGIGGRRENGYRFLPTLREAGLPTLLISYRNDEGAPAAPNGFYAFGLDEWHDLDAAVNLALDRGAQSVVLLGESMGGGIVGQFLRRSDHADRVKAIVLDAPAVDFSAVMIAEMRRMNIPLARLLARGGIWLTALRSGLDFADADVTEEFASFAGPLFISHGRADGIVPVTTSDHLVSQRRALTDYLRTGANHIQSWKENPARYDAALLAFLRSLP